MEILQLVPSLPPPMEGVGTYAAALAEALAATGIGTSFLSATELRDRDRLAEALEERGPKAALMLLHYANYGFAARGCPFWLERGLRAWKAGAPERRLVTLFHEVYATGAPWRSSFWLSPAQRRLAARVTRLSDGLVTTLEIYRRLLAPWAGRLPVAVWPVFSTVGEPVLLTPLGDRPPRMAVFGGSGTRRRAYLSGGRSLAAACRGLGLEEIVDIGPLLETAAPELEGFPVRSLGPLPAAAVSRELMLCRAGFATYPPPFLPKSTLFAAYCAHGLMPVCAWSGGASPDGPPFWNPAEEAAPPPDTVALAGAAQRWYSGHALGRQAAAFHDLLLVTGAADSGRGVD